MMTTKTTLLAFFLFFSASILAQKKCYYRTNVKDEVVNLKITKEYLMHEKLQMDNGEFIFFSLSRDFCCSAETISWQTFTTARVHPTLTTTPICHDLASAETHNTHTHTYTHTYIHVSEWGTQSLSLSLSLTHTHTQSFFH